jgi:hypothetical protein
MTKNSDGTVTFSRNIDQLCIDNGAKDVCRKTGTPVFNKFHMLITTIPPTDQKSGNASIRWLEPALVTIEFE